MALLIEKKSRKKISEVGTFTLHKPCCKTEKKKEQDRKENTVMDGSAESGFIYIVYTHWPL